MFGKILRHLVLTLNYMSTMFFGFIWTVNVFMYWILSLVRSINYNYYYHYYNCYYYYYCHFYYYNYYY